MEDITTSATSVGSGDWEHYLSSAVSTASRPRILGIFVDI